MQFYHTLQDFCFFQLLVEIVKHADEVVHWSFILWVHASCIFDLWHHLQWLYRILILFIHLM